MKNIIISFIFCLIFLSCDTVSNVASFVNCKYAIAGFSNPSVAGISLANLNDVNNLNAANLLKLTSGIMSGSLPLNATINVNATNPNSTAAKIAGFDWAIDMESSNILSGTINQTVTVPANGGETIIPLTIQTDILKLVQGESKNDIMNFVNSMLNIGDSSSKISLRIRPSIMVGNQKIQTGFITLSKKV